MFIRKGIINLHPTHIATKGAYLQVREYVNAFTIRLKPEIKKKKSEQNTKDFIRSISGDNFILNFFHSDVYFLLPVTILLTILL